MTTKERLRALKNVTPVEIGGQTFHVRAVSLSELEQIDRDVKDCGELSADELKVSYARRLLAAAVCEADGEQVFSAFNDPDIDTINTQALRELTDAAAEANGVGGADGGNG